VRIERSRIAKLAAMPNHFGRHAVDKSSACREAQRQGGKTKSRGAQKKAEQAEVGPPGQSKRT
jgi:hypothetical protein